MYRKSCINITTDGVKACLLLLVAGLTGGAWAQLSSLKPVAISRQGLCVTEGEISALPDAHLSVNVPSARAYVMAITPQVIEVQFRYLGRTKSESSLGSGETRQQFGVKLRAQDPCNLVYAMWRIEPESKVVVSIKSNPAEHTSAECTNHGYHDIKPRRTKAVPILRPGDQHVLRAELLDAEIRVFVDGVAVWEGNLGQDSLKIDGPVGFRSDNVHLDFVLRAVPPIEAPPSQVWPCTRGSGLIHKDAPPT
jgi:hypothetical protein